MARGTMAIPKFKTESDEAEWWASPAVRSYVKRKSSSQHAKGVRAAGSHLVAELSKKKEYTDCHPVAGG